MRGLIVGREGSRVGEYRYRPAWWLPDGHTQTLWGRFFRRAPRLSITVECLRTGDGDNLEVHTLDAPPAAPSVLMLHGLEGSVRSHYVGGFFAQAQRRGWNASLLVFRGCGTAPNVAPRFYHSGETSDLAFAFSTLAARRPGSPWFLAGVSLGGNVLLRWLGEIGAPPQKPKVLAAAAVSVPLDLEAGAQKIARGFARVYDRAFLRSLRRKALAKLERYPGLFDRDRLVRARNIVDFDDAVTAPVHGFAGASDYYERCSSIHALPHIRVPTLLLAARDDPFLPPAVLDRAREVAGANPRVTLEIHERGGHVGFVTGLPWRAGYYADDRIFRFFDVAMERR